MEAGGVHVCGRSTRRHRIRSPRRGSVGRHGTRRGRTVLLAGGGPGRVGTRRIRLAGLGWQVAGRDTAARPALARAATAESNGAQHYQRHADQQHHEAADQQADEHRQEQVCACPCLQIHAHRRRRVGIHDHHGPGSGAEVPGQFLFPRAGGSRGPEGLLRRIGRDLGAGHFAVQRAEGVEPDVDDFGAPDTGQVRRDVGPRGNSDEDFLAGIGGGTAEQHAARNVHRNAVVHAAAGHEVQPGGRQRVGIA